MAKLNMPILLGTGRQGRLSEKVANYLLAQAEKYGFNSEIIDVRDFAGPATIPYWQPDPADDSWRQTMSQAHGLIIVTPEYNHGYPGELKIMLDKLYEEYNHKPVGIAAVSSGPFSGTRVIQALKLIFGELQMVGIFNNLHFGNVAKLFDDSGKIIDDAYDKRAIKMFDEITWYAERLKK